MTRSKLAQSPKHQQYIEAVKQVAKNLQYFLKSFPNVVTIQNQRMFLLGEFT